MRRAPAQRRVHLKTDPTQRLRAPLAEGGLLIGIPALITVLAFIQLVWKRFRHASESTMTWWVRVGAVTGILAMALQEVVEFSLQIPGNAVLFVVMMAVAVHDPMPVQKRVRSEVRLEAVEVA